MKTRPELRVRDALAEIYVQAAGGDASAVAAVEALALWRPGEPAREVLRARRTAEGIALFSPAGFLMEPYVPLSDYMLDRARRFGAALAWILEERATGDPIACARAAWDAGLFFEVHEILEPVWLQEHGEQRRILQGLIMAGAALHHLTHGNLAGARGLLRDATSRLREPPADEPLDLAHFARGLDALADGIEQGHVRQLSDMRELPKLLPRAASH